MGRLLRSPNKGLFLSSEVATPRLLARSTRQSTRFRTAAEEVEHHWSFWKARYCQVSRPLTTHNVCMCSFQFCVKSQSQLLLVFLAVFQVPISKVTFPHFSSLL